MMYKVEYKENEIEKDQTYDNAYYSCINNGNKKWENYYAYLKEKYDLCYNVESITIDIEDIKKMKFECFSNGILLKLYLLCKKKGFIEKYEQIIIPNNSLFSEELIYNIFKTDWLIDESLINENDLELKGRKNYFEAMIEASEEREDIKIQFRNRLYEYFLQSYKTIKENKCNAHSDDKILKLEKNLIKD